MPGSNRASFKLLKANKLKVLKKTVQFTLYIVCECCTLPPHYKPCLSSILHYKYPISELVKRHLNYEEYRSIILNSNLAASATICDPAYT